MSICSVCQVNINSFVNHILSDIGVLFLCVIVCKLTMWEWLGWDDILLFVDWDMFVNVHFLSMDQMCGHCSSVGECVIWLYIDLSL